MKVKGFFLALTLVLAFSIVGGEAGSANAQNIQRMTVEQLKEKIGSPNLVVIDVRSDGDWKSSELKIKGAVREDPSIVESWMTKYPRNETIVFYCA